MRRAAALHRNSWPLQWAQYVSRAMSSANRPQSIPTINVTASDGVRLAVYKHDPTSEPAIARPSVLLIHGWAWSADDWGDVPQLLADATSRSVITYDARGCGRSDTPAVDARHYSLSRMAADAVSVWMAAKGPPTCESAQRSSPPHPHSDSPCSGAHVVGSSMGALVALELASTTTIPVHSAALCATLQLSFPDGVNAETSAAAFFQTFTQWEEEGDAARESTRRRCAAAFVVAGTACLLRA